MPAPLRFLWFALLAFFAAQLVAGKEDSNGAVQLLTTSNFDEFIKANPVSLVKFMAPWCGHCKKLAPDYEAAAVELKNDVPLAEVDATQEAELAKKYNVQGFPTIFLFRDGEPEPYTGGRTSAAIVDWVKKMTGPSVEYFTKSEDAVKKADTSAITFIAYLTSKTSEEAKTFETVAGRNRSKGNFYAVVDTKTPSAMVKVHRGTEEVVSVPITTEKKLQSWIEVESIPLFGPINGENYGSYAQRSSNWVWVAANKEDYEKIGDNIRKVSKNYRTEFNFVWLDIQSLKHHAEAVLGLKDYPSIAVVWEDSKYHFKDEIAEKHLTKFIENVKSGKVKKFLKSEPVPESNSDLVKVVVGSQFSEIVLQKDKDVFLKIYAPWCGHCKKLTPIWEELAEKTKTSKNFVVAKFDGTSNEPDVPGFDFNGFPTIYFVKAGSKEPMPYDGERTLEGFISFAKKHAAHPLVVSEGDENKDEL